MSMIDCAGCGKRHESNHSRYKKDPRTGKDAWFCDKWFRKSGKKITDYAPGEIASGVHLGMDYQECFGSLNNQEDFSVERSRQLKELTEAISE